MKYGFIYQWEDSKTGLKYIGRHEGSLDDGYIGSGTVFRKYYNNRPNDFLRTILWEGYITHSKDLKNKELEFLSSILEEELFHGSNRKYFNISKISDGYTSDDNPMKNPTVRKQVSDTFKRLGYPNVGQRYIEKHGEEAYRRMLSETSMGNQNGKGNIGTTKSEEHKKNISNSIKIWHKNRTESGNRGGRKHSIDPKEFLETYNKLGHDGTVEYYGLTSGAVRNRYFAYKRYFKEKG